MDIENENDFEPRYNPLGVLPVDIVFRWFFLFWASATSVPADKSRENKNS